MIQRNPLNAAVSHSEPLHQASFTAMKGIDATKAITVPNVVNNLENLNVNLDGSVSPRKALIIKRDFKLSDDFKAKCVIPTYLSEYYIVVYANGSNTYIAVEDTSKERYIIKFLGEYLDYSGVKAFDVPVPTDFPKLYNVTDLFDFENPQHVNTLSNTIIGNVLVNLTHDSLNFMYDSGLQDENSAKESARYLKLIKDDSSDVFELTVKTPEVNTLDTGSTLQLDPNLTLDNPYSIRDMYDSNYISIDGVLPYTYSTSENVPDKIKTFDTGESVEQDTHSSKYSSKSFDIKPPSSPLIVEFFVDPTKMTDSYQSDTMLSKSKDYILHGGCLKIYLNKFRFNDNPVPCTTEPYKVNVTVSARCITPDAPVYTDFNGEPTSGGEFIKQTYTYDTDTITNAHDGKGYYVELCGTPNVQPLIGHLPSATVPTAVDNMVYLNETMNVWSDDNSIVAGAFETNMVTSVSTSNGWRYAKSNITAKRDGNKLFKYEGLSVFKMSIVAEITYLIGGKELKYSNECSIGLSTVKNKNYAISTASPYTWVHRWGQYFSANDSTSSRGPDSVVGRNYPVLLNTAKPVVPTITPFDSEVTEYSFFNGICTVKETVTRKLNATPYSENYTFSNGVSATVFSDVFSESRNVVLNIQVKDIGNAHVLNCKMKASSNSTVVEDSFTYRNSDKTQLTEKTYNVASDSSGIDIAFSATRSSIAVEIPDLRKYTVKDVTERVSYPKFQLTNTMHAGTDATVLLKAFMNFIKDTSLTYYGVWEYSYDGWDWKSWYVLPGNTDALDTLQKVTLSSYKMREDADILLPGEIVEHPAIGVKISADSPNDEVFKYVETDSKFSYVVPARADVLLLQSFNAVDADVMHVSENVNVSSVRLRYTVVEEVKNSTGVEYRTLATTFYTPSLGLKYEPATVHVKNASLGDKLYYKKSIYSYNNAGFKNTVLKSDVNSFITPLGQIIDVPSNAKSIVTSVVPWRDYLVVFTDSDVHLATIADQGAFVKTVSTYIGVNEQDRKTCKALLNGVVFKSGSKFYTLYPNTSSGDESILNLNEISRPINHILEQLPDTPYDVFSISTERKYYTFIPYDSHTYSVVYDYDLKVWYTNKYESVRFTDYVVDSLDNITVYGVCDGVLTEYYFERDLKDVRPNFIEDWGLELFEDVPHGDFLTQDSITPPSTGGFPNPNPIRFTLDSGQRTDNLSLTRKFVESKFLLATLNAKSAAAKDLTVSVYVDGNPYKIRLKGDGIVYKDNPDQILTLNENVNSDDSDVYNTVSQVYLRYSGKGKTIRHVIKGESLYNFKLYEVFYRYRPTPNKQ